MTETGWGYHSDANLAAPSSLGDDSRRLPGVRLTQPGVAPS
jgi:hypothetical protein